MSTRSLKLEEIDEATRRSETLQRARMGVITKLFSFQHDTKPY